MCSRSRKNGVRKTVGMPRPLLRGGAEAATKRARNNREDSVFPQARSDLPAFSRSDKEGSAAAAALRPQDAPARIHSTEGLNNKVAQYGANPQARALVRRNILNHSTFMAVVDLRDDPARSADGTALRRGAIWTPGTTESVAKVSVQIYTEILGNSQRAEEELAWIAAECGGLRELSVEVVGEDNLAVAVAIRDTLARGYWAIDRLRCDAALTVTASLYETEA